MGVTKTTSFTASTNKLAIQLKVLGHPARIAILEYILKQQSCICTDLIPELGLAQATISQHLNELKSIELIQGTVEGTSMCYCINEQKWNELTSELSIFFNQYQQSKLCC